MKTPDSQWQPVIRIREEEGFNSELISILPLLKADDHDWGTGHVHQINPDNDTTLCGQSPARCPGSKFFGEAHQITCKACIRSREAREAQEARSRAWEEQRAKEQAKFNEGRELRREHYKIYRQTPVWRDRRMLVLEREGGLCQGCRRRRATQVHHTRYPQGCLPGSDEWIDQELLFDLIGLCDGCHARAHRRSLLP